MKSHPILAALAMAGALGMSSIAGAMRSFDDFAPAMSGSARSTKAQIDRDGIGRRVKPKSHPKHNAKRNSTAFDRFRRKVMATHSFNDDPRDDKYLHSHARQMRALKRRLAA